MERMKSTFSKAGKLVLLFLILAAVLPGTTVFAKVRLSKSSVRIYTGNKVTLKVKGTKKKVSWSISGKNGKKLVSITTKGKKKQTAVIKAKKKTGSCYVVAKVGKKKLSCKVTVKKKQTSTITPVVTPTPAPQIKVTDSTILALANTSLKLAKEASAANSTGTNMLVSPQSILNAVALVENGASGRTLTEMESAVGGLPVGNFTNYLSAMNKRLSSSGQTTYQTANSVWYKEGKVQLKESYIKSVQNSLGAEVYGAPFDSSTVNKINNWVSNKTNAKIKEIIDRLDPEAATVLINAIYFKGAWADEYTGTVSRTFTDYAGRKTNTAMLEGTESTYLTLGGAEGFVKPYSSGDIAFLALLPPSGKTAAEFLKTISGEDFVNAYANRQSSNIRVHTRMPEFQCEYKIKLNDVLKKLGIQTAFLDSADFSNMSNLAIKIDEVLHKTYIKVDQHGTEAAAVTAVVAKCTSAYPGSVTEKWVYLDRPFVYALVDRETGLPLFLGTVEKV